MTGETKLTKPMRDMLIYSEQGNILEGDGVGVELMTGAAHSTARALVRRGWGHIVAPRGLLPGMYWNNSSGLEARRAALAAAEEGK